LRGTIGKVTVGFAGTAVLSGKLVDDLRDFRRLYPEVEIELREIVPHLQREAILEERIDLGYCPNTGLILVPDVIATKIGEWRFLLAMATDHSLAKKKRVSIKSLANESLILYSGDENDASLAYFHNQLGTVLRPPRRMQSTLSVLALAAAGVGIALVPAPVDAMEIPHLTYRPIAEKEMSADLLLLHRTNETKGSVKAFISLVLQRQENQLDLA